MEKDIRPLVESLDARMREETAFFDGLGQSLDTLRDSFERKKWIDAVATSEGIQVSARAIERADAARDDAFVSLREALDLPRETAFSAVLPSLPSPQRELLEESWRSLRMSIVRLKTGSSRMRYAAESLSRMLNRILDEAFPYRKGKIYSRRGTPTGVTGALIVDHKL